MAGENSFFDNDGGAVDVYPLYPLEKNQVAYVDGWLGITSDRAESGELLALDITPRAYQFTVPAGLAVSKGDVVFITVANVTEHIPDDNAYSTTAGTGKIAFFKATTDKDADNVVIGIVIQGNIAS